MPKKQTQKEPVRDRRKPHNMTLSYECVLMLDAIAKSTDRSRSRAVEYMVRDFARRKGVSV